MNQHYELHEFLAQIMDPKNQWVGKVGSKAQEITYMSALPKIDR